MVYDIAIGRYKLGMISSVNIKRSVEQLTDTAVISLPGTMYNKAINSTTSGLDHLEKSVQRGNQVVIRLGYNDVLYTEFTGYIEHIENENDQLKIYVEDSIFQYRKPLPDTEHKSVNVSKLLQWVISMLGLPYSLSCDYDITYDKFVVSGNTGYDVLKKIQEELKPNIYMKGNVLHVHPQYTEIFGAATYNFAENIEKSNLKYRDAEQRKLLVEVQGKGADGRVLKVEEGSTGGDKITLNVSGVSRADELRTIARQALLSHGGYTGYEGSFTGWLIPYCDAGFKVSLTDNDYKYKNGSYYVTAIEVNFSENGAERVVTLGKKIE